MELSKLNIFIPLKGNSTLLHNTFSKKTILLDPNEYQRIISSTSDSLENFLPYSLFQRLAKISAITTSSANQIDQIKAKDHNHKQSTDHLMITVMMTEACNFSCQYCNQGLNKQVNHISLNVMDKIHNYINTLEPTPKSLSLTWYGGEPLIRSKDIISSSSFLKRKTNEFSINYSSVIVTNGYMLNGNMANALFEAGVSIAQITIDGSKTDHDNSRYIKEGVGTYDQIMNNISLALTQSKLKVVIRVNVDKRNSARLTHLIDDLYSRCILLSDQFSIYLSHVYDPELNSLDKQEDVKSSLLSHIDFAQIQYEINNYILNLGGNVAVDLPNHEGACIASHKYSFAIKPDGSLYKCYIPIANKNESFGSIDNISQSYNHSNFEKWNSWSPFDSENCGSCKLIGSCRGGCRFNYVSNEYRSEPFKCPPAKYFTNEYLFQRAVSKGLVEPNQWDPINSPTNIKELRFS